MRLTKRIRKGLKGKGRRKTICGGKKTKRGGGKTPFLRNQAALKRQVDELNLNIKSQVGDITDNKRLKSKYENMSLTELEDLLDELDFEDVREDKYVYLDKSFNLICEYNYKFKRWVPISLAGENDKITTYNMII